MSTTLPLDAMRTVMRNLPGGLSETRQAALAAFAERGFPTVRDEDWKYTDLRNAIEISREWLRAGAPAPRVDDEWLRRLQSGTDASWLVITNGVLSETHSSALGVPGLDVELTDAPPAGSEGPLADLNTALGHSGVSLRVSATYADDKPLALLVADTATGTPVSSQVRVALHLERGAAVSFIEHHASTGEAAHYSNALINVVLEPDANCRYVRLQERAFHHSQTARLDVSLAAGASFEHFGVDIGGKLARNDLTVSLAGKRSSVTLNGLYLAGPGQHIDNHTRIDHRVGPATSRQEYRGILSGRCRAVWNGKAIVHKGADGTDAKQANHNLLLSEHAEIDAKPELEIYADDVKAAHGTTVGQLDPRALFYLRTRGIEPAPAERMLTRAFAATVVDTVPIESLRERFGQKVEARLQTLASGEPE